jgi:hypothetical protein
VLSHLTRARMATLVGGGGRAGRGATAGVEDSTKGAAVAVLCGREEHGGNGESEKWREWRGSSSMLAA